MRAIAAAVHAHRVCTQQRVIGEELGTRRAVLMKELRCCIKSVDEKQQADQIAGTHSAESLAQLQRAIVCKVGLKRVKGIPY